MNSALKKYKKSVRGQLKAAEDDGEKVDRGSGPDYEFAMIDVFPPLSSVSTTILVEWGEVEIIDLSKPD